MSVADLPQTGYYLERVYVSRQMFVGYADRSQFPDGELGELTFGWDWSFASEEAFDVALSMKLDPTKARPESIEVALTGRFIRHGKPLLPVGRFASLHAPAILMPYLREVMSALSGRGLSGALYLPPINVEHLMQNMDEESTTAAQQMKENPGLAGAAEGS